MTYSINIGKKQVWDVSNCTREIFDIVRKKLESGKEGSKFKYFHLLNENGVIKYKKSNLDSILNDFEKVTQGLNLVKRPVASLYIKNMEMGYAYGHIDGDEWVSSKDKGFGINEKGMFVRTGLHYTCEAEYKYFKELKKGEEYFDDFLQLGGMHMWKFHPTKYVLNKVDRITHNFKSANIVHGGTLKKLKEFVHMAQKEKKSIEIY